MCRLPLFHLDDVISVLRLDDLRIAYLLREDGAVEFRHHVAALRKSKFAARVLAARVIGILLRELGKVRPALNLLEKSLGLGLGGSFSLGICTLIYLDQNVPRFRLLRK